MLVSLTVGKVDAGVAVLLTEDKRLIEFPSVLLPPDISSGSIVDVAVSRNLDSESRATQKFTALQDSIYRTFGENEPSTPDLRCRNATQTSVVLEWDPIDLATSELRSLSLYRNGQKAGNIPRPREMLSTKISGLAVDTEYNFHLVLKTSAGTFTSPKLTVRTHKMTQLNGISVTAGIMPQALLTSLKETLDRIGGKLIDGVRIDTTHFVTTEGRGRDWEKAVEMNVPVVVPDWVKGCEREGRLVGVRGYYLNADPRLRQVGQSAALGAQQSTGSQEQIPQRPRTPLQSPRTEITPPTPEAPVPPASQSLAASQPAASQQNGAEDEAETEKVQGGSTSSTPEPQAAARNAEDSEEDDETDTGDEDGKQEAAGKGAAADDPPTNVKTETSERGREEAGDFDEVQL